MARMNSPFFQKFVFSFFLHPPIGTAPRPEQLYEVLAAPISQKAALCIHRDWLKSCLIREGIRRTTVPRLGFACRFSEKSFFHAFSILLYVRRRGFPFFWKPARLPFRKTLRCGTMGIHTNGVSFARESVAPPCLG